MKPVHMVYLATGAAVVGLGAWALTRDASAAPKKTAPTPSTGDLAFRTIERMQGGALPTDAVPVVIFLHSRQTKPEQYADYDVGMRSRLVLPEGPVKLPPSRGWFKAKAADADQETLAAQMRWTAERLGPFLASYVANIPHVGKPILVGLSQGASMALALSTMYPGQFAGVVEAAGWLPRSMWTANVPYTVAIHGTADTTVPFGPAQEWAAWMATKSAPLSWNPISGMGHAPNAQARTIFKDAIQSMVVEQ